MQLHNHDSHPPLQATAEAKSFNDLPFDILWGIFSYLNHAEVLEAMAVCRKWYEHIPFYTTHLWRNVTVSAKEGGLINRRKAQCLGTHVHTVIVSFYKGNATFQKDMEEFVERTNGSAQVAVLCFCSSFQSTGFYTGLSILGEHLTRLVFSDHLGNNLDFFDVMNACPRLTYFEMQRPGVLVTRTIPSQHTKYPALTDLLMDGTPCADFNFELILMRCPGLRLLGFTQRKWVPGDIVNLTLHCRHLQSLYYVDTELPFAKLRRQDAIRQQRTRQGSAASLCYMGDGEEQGLRELSIQPIKLGGVLSVSALVDKHLATLECLRLHNCFYSHLDTRTVAQSLTQLVLSNVETHSHDLVGLFTHCPNITDLTFAQSITTFTTDVIEALTTGLTRLERLDFDLLYINSLRVPPARWAFQSLLRLFSGIQRNENMHLRELHIVGKNIPIDDDVLYSIAGLKTVEVLSISSAFCTDAGLAAFAERLSSNTNNSFSHKRMVPPGSPTAATSTNHHPLRQLLRISLYNISALFAPHVLAAFGDLDVLEDFCLTDCTRVTGAGLLNLSRKANSLVILRLFRCYIIDEVDWIDEARSSVGAVYYDHSDVQSDMVTWEEEEEEEDD